MRLSFAQCGDDEVDATDVVSILASLIDQVSGTLEEKGNVIDVLDSPIFEDKYHILSNTSSCENFQAIRSQPFRPSPRSDREHSCLSVKTRHRPHHWTLHGKHYSCIYHSMVFGGITFRYLAAKGFRIFSSRILKSPPILLSVFGLVFESPFLPAHEGERHANCSYEKAGMQYGSA